MVTKSVPKQVRVIALIIWFLSGNADLGMSYVLSRRTAYDLEGVNLNCKASVALLLTGWLAEVTVRVALHTGLSTLNDAHRVVADQYLLHSLLIEFVITQNRKGVAVDLTSIVAKYIRLWSYRPMADIVSRRLAKLVWHRASRRRFGVNLRREWGLCFNKFADSRDLTSEQIRAKARVLQQM